MILTIVIVYFLVYKEIMLINNTQDPNVTNYAKGILENYKNPKEITIEAKEAKEYIEYKGLKIENKFKNYEKNEAGSDSIQYVVYNNGSMEKLFSVGNSLTYTEIYAEGYDTYNENVTDVSLPLGKKTLYDKEKVYNYLKENKVTKDSELFKFIVENFDNKSNILTSTSKMKENEYVKEFVVNIMPRIKEYTILNGTVDGFMFKLIAGGYEIHIGNYAIILIGQTEEEVLELVRTIKIDEEK